MTRSILRGLPARVRAAAERHPTYRAKEKTLNRAMRRPTWNDITFRSKTEVQYAMQLEAERALGLISRWRYEPMKLDIGARRSYRIDFMVRPHDGKPILIEVKGFKRVGSRRVYHDTTTRLRFALAREKHGDKYQFRYVRAVGGGRFEESIVK